MGFNIMVCGDTDDTYQEQDFFINRSYYTFVANYEMFGDEALIIKAGEYYGLDLHPLTIVAYLDNLEPEEQEEATQNAGELLALIKAFAEHLQREPEMIDKVQFEYKAVRSTWEEYTRSGQLLTDLADVSKALTYYQKIGKPEVFFGVG
jgi:hypothetical protein